MIELVFAAVSRNLQEKVVVLSNSIMNTEANLSSVTLRGFDTISTTKSISAETTFFSQWRRHETAYLGARKGIRRIAELTHFWSGCHDTVMDAAILFVGASLILRGDFTLGAMISVQTMIRRIQKSLRDTVLAADELSGCFADLSKAEDILQQESKPLRENDAPAGDVLSGDLVVNDVSFTYPDSAAPVLDHISFSVKAGRRSRWSENPAAGKAR